MKRVLLSSILFVALAAGAQPTVQPLASGNYWEIDSYAARLPQLATKATFPLVIHYTNGAVGINELSASRLNNENEIIWNVGSATNASQFVVELSRDGYNFERAGVVRLESASNGRYVFRHLFDINPLVYYRIGIISGANTIAYTPAVQLLDEEYTTKVFPTVVKGSTFYVQTARAFEKIQVVNSGGSMVYEKGINNQTGTLTVGLPSLPTGIYFVRLLSNRFSPHVQRIVVE